MTRKKDRDSLWLVIDLRHGDAQFVRASSWWAARVKATSESQAHRLGRDEKIDPGSVRLICDRI